MKIIVKWVGAEKNTARYGHMVYGRVVELPEDIANDFIKQGLAKLHKPKTSSKGDK